MKNGFWIAFTLLLCVSCAPDPDATITSEASTEVNKTAPVEVESASDKTEPQSSSEEKPTALNTAPESPVDKPVVNVAPSHVRASDSPFGDGSGGFNGPGTGSGTGNGFGDGAPKITRKLIADIDRSAFVIQQSASIRLHLTVDASGSVVKAFVNEDYTTSEDQELLDKVMFAVKREVKYNKVPDAPLMKVDYKVYIEGTEMPVYVH